MGGHAINFYKYWSVSEQGPVLTLRQKKSTDDWLFDTDDDCVCLVSVLIGSSTHFRDGDCFEVANLAREPLTSRKTTIGMVQDLC